MEKYVIETLISARLTTSREIKAMFPELQKQCDLEAKIYQDLLHLLRAATYEDYMALKVQEFRAAEDLPELAG